MIFGLCRIWKLDNERGNYDFKFENTDNSAFHNRVEAVINAYDATYVPYKNGQVDFDYFAVFTVDVEVSSSRKITHPNTNQEIAKIIVDYGGDYNKMYSDNVMGIASGSQHSQDIAKDIISSVQSITQSNMSSENKIKNVIDTLDVQQKIYNQTIHEENLVKNQTENKTQWVDTDINKQFGHLGGTSEAKRQEQEKKENSGKCSE